jgi:hypothetical protein
VERKPLLLDLNDPFGFLEKIRGESQEELEKLILQLAVINQNLQMVGAGVLHELMKHEPKEEGGELAKLRPLSERN